MKDQIGEGSDERKEAGKKKPSSKKKRQGTNCVRIVEDQIEAILEQRALATEEKKNDFDHATW